MISHDEHERATARSDRRRRDEPWALDARYDRQRDRIVVHLSTGLEIAFAPRDAQGLENATAEDLATIEISPSGLGLHFPRLDADLYLPGLLEGYLGSKRWMAARLGRTGGGARSPAKTAASRTNGRLGGRPRKIARHDR
jgi:Protein of unknown function (DUF2442)